MWRIRRQIEFLSEHFRLTSVPEVFTAAQNKSTERLCAITFDDGLRDQYIHAVPILRKHRATATFFIITGTFAGFVPIYSEMIKCESYIPVVECGAARVAMSMEEIREMIENYTENPVQDRENRTQAVKFAMGPTDGYSYKHIARQIDTILERESKQ